MNEIKKCPFCGCDAPFPDDYCSECEFYEKCGNNEAILLEVLAEPHNKENDA